MALERISVVAALGAALALLDGCSAAAPRGAPARTPARAAAPVSIADLGWLLGAWRGRGEEGETFEQVAVRDDSTFSIVYYTDSTRTATHPVAGTIEERAGRVYHTRGAARWVVAGGFPTSLHFHPVEGADTRLHWSYEPPPRTAAVTRTDSLGREVTRSYVFSRVYHEHPWRT